jgi:lysozyme family protein
MTPDEMWTASAQLVLNIEGVYDTNPKDKGNWTGGAVGAGKLNGTKYGIDCASYPTLDIKNLTKDAALDIYKRDYWDKNRCGEMPWPISAVVFDGEVNQGNYGVKALQISLGVVGEETMRALAAYNDVWELASYVIAHRAVQYSTLKAFSVYGLGWFRRLALLCLAVGKRDNTGNA